MCHMSHVTCQVSGVRCQCIVQYSSTAVQEAGLCQLLREEAQHAGPGPGGDGPGGSLPLRLLLHCLGVLLTGGPGPGGGWRGAAPGTPGWGAS